MFESAQIYCVEAKNYGFEIEWDVPLHLIAEQQLATMTQEELDKDLRLEDFFGSIYVINLPSAKDRKEAILKELQQVGVQNVEFFVAVDGRKELEENIWKKFKKNNRDRINGDSPAGRIALENYHQAEAGCFMSHYTLLKQIKESFDNAMEQLRKAEIGLNQDAIKEAKIKLKKYCRVLILEDDAAFGFVNSKGTKASKDKCGQHFREAIRNLPENWDILYLVVNAAEPAIKMTKNLYKMNQSWSLTGYAVNYTMYEPLVNELQKIEDPNVAYLLPVDTFISIIHHLHNVYAIYPSLVYTQDFPSQISPISRNKLWQGQPVYHKKRKF